jgi:hypothetical protein
LGPRRQPGRQRAALVGRRRQDLEVPDQLELIAGHALQHRDRIEELLARALERLEGSRGPAVGQLALQLVEVAARVGHRLARVGHVQIEVLELDQAHLLLVGALVLGLAADRGDLVAGQIGDLADLGRQGPLPHRRGLELVLARQRIAARRGLVVPQPARRVAQRSLGRDRPIEPRLELVGPGAGGVDQRQEPRLDPLEVGARVGVVGPAPDRVGQPGPGPIVSGDRLRRLGRLGAGRGLGPRDRDRRQIERGAEPHLVVEARQVARGQELALGLVEGAALELGHAGVVALARRAPTIVATPGDRDHHRHHEPDDPRSHDGLRARAPTTSAAMSANSASATGHAKRSPRTRRTDMRSASARRIGVTFERTIDSRSSAEVPAGT